MRRASSIGSRGLVLVCSAAACNGSAETDGESASVTDEPSATATDDSATSETSASATDETETSDETGSTTAGDNELVLDPDTLEVFELPIGSLRYAVAGQDLDSDTCVTLVWWASPNLLCDQPDMQDWPYVLITPNAQAPCMQWDYSGNVSVEDAQGCVEFTLGPLSAEVDVSVEVSGDLFSGTIIASNI